MGCGASKEAAGPAPGAVQFAAEEAAGPAKALEKPLVKTAEQLAADAELAELRRLTLAFYTPALSRLRGVQESTVLSRFWVLYRYFNI